MAVRATFSSGCCAESETPEVWVCVRSCQDLGFLAPTRSRIRLAQRRRAARILATSSKKSMWKLKKKENRGRKSSGSRPRATRSST